VSAVLTPTHTATPWRQALPALGLLLVAIVALYRDTFAVMVGIWARSDTFAHAYLVPPIVMWLMWRRREALAPYTPAPQPWVLLPMLGVAAIWLLGDMAGINAVTQLCATALLVLAVPAVLGLAVARQLAFPLGFLFFMVPIGEFLLPVMMESTADFTVAAVSLSGVPVYREGLNFIIPSGAWSVVEACSGVRYLIASFMVGTLFAYLNYASTWRRWVFVGVSIAIPIVANWLRAYMIVMLGHLSGNKIAVGVDHLIYGWLFFGVVILLMFMVGARWSEPEAQTAAPTPVPLGRSEPKVAHVWPVAAAAAAVLALAPALAAHVAYPAERAGVTLVLPSLPGTPMPTQGEPLLRPVTSGSAALAHAQYGADAEAVTVHVAYYRYQGYGAKVAGSDNQLIQPEDKAWSRASIQGRTTVRVADQDVTMRVDELVGGPLAERKRIEARQVYWVGGHFTVSDPWATALGLWGRLTGQGDDAALITIYTPGDSATTGPRLDAFIARHLGTLQATLAAVQSRR
jgi:exosortase A